MRTATSIQISAPREAIFAVVSNVPRWPEWLPHYRFVRKIDQGSRGDVLQMSAIRSGIPVTWTSEYWCDERSLELHFQHLRLWTKGMKVVWTLTPTRDGTRVEIIHDFRFRARGLAWLAEPIICRFFVDHIAGRTLATFKRQLESAASHASRPV